MTEFETELLKRLKGIQRELVIQNAPPEVKQKQILLFNLEDALYTYRLQLDNDSTIIKEDTLERYKQSMEHYNRLANIDDVREI